MTRFRAAALKLPNRGYPYSGRVGQFLLGPVEEPPRCSALRSRDHNYFGHKRLICVNTIVFHLTELTIVFIL